MPRGGIWAFGTGGKDCASAQPGPIYDGLDNDSPLWMTYILPYTKSTQVFYCPSGPHRGEGTEWTSSQVKNPQTSFGYAYNPYVLPQDHWEVGQTLSTGLPDCTISNPSKAAQSILISRFTEPSVNVMLSDHGQFGQPTMVGVSSGAPSGIYVRKQGQHTDSVTPDKYGTNPSSRHFDGANHLYIDGHVKWLSHENFKKAIPQILVGGIS
jgi:hypothetical protein